MFGMCDFYFFLISNYLSNINTIPYTGIPKRKHNVSNGLL